MISVLDLPDRLDPITLSDKSDENNYLNEHRTQRRINNLVKYIRWSFLRRLLSNESR